MYSSFRTMRKSLQDGFYKNWRSCQEAASAKGESPTNDPFRDESLRFSGAHLQPELPEETLDRESVIGE